MVLSGVPRKKSPVTPPGIDPGTVRLVAQRLNHYATPGPYIYIQHFIKIRLVWAELFHASRRMAGHEEANSRYSRFCERA